MAFNYSPKVVTDGLVLYLDAANTKSYPGSGTTWTDLSRSESNGTLVNGPTFNNGNGGSIVFDGSNDYASTSFNTALTNFTVCIWFKPTDSTNRASARLIDKEYITGFYLGKNYLGTANSWGGGIRESAAPYGRYLTLPDGQWNFLVSIRSGTTNTLYGNGITNTTSGTVSSTALNTQNLFISSINGAPYNYNFKGNIAQVSIYNRALSAAEVLQNYNATKTRFGL